MRKRASNLITEVSYYPDYMRFTISELDDLFKSFTKIFTSIWHSFQLLTATIKLNMQVVMGTWSGNKAEIERAYQNFDTARAQYDRRSAEDLEYFKKYYLSARRDNLGGFGPKVLAFAANPMLFASAEVATTSVDRRSGELAPYDSRKPWKSIFGEPASKKTGGDALDTETGTAVAGAASARLDRALKFFEYRGSLSEAAAVPNVTPQQQKEIQKLNAIARDYVANERKHAEEILTKISGFSSALRKLLEAKTFDELIQALRSAEKLGIQMKTSNIASSSDRIRSEFEKQQKEKPEEFKKAVAEMIKTAPDVESENDVESAMKFIFGASKTSMQHQLINVQNDLIASSRKAMNLPIDAETRSLLGQSQIGLEYLRMMDDFDRKLVTGEREVAAAKKVLRT